MSLNDFFNLGLDEIFSVVSTSEPELEVAPTIGEVELVTVKTVVASVKELSIRQISILSEITEVVDLLIDSSIPEDYKVVLAKIRDQLPLLVSNVRLAS